MATAAVWLTIGRRLVATTARSKVRRTWLIWRERLRFWRQSAATGRFVPDERRDRVWAFGSAVAIACLVLLLLRLFIRTDAEDRNPAAVNDVAIVEPTEVLALDDPPAVVAPPGDLVFTVVRESPSADEPASVPSERAPLELILPEQLPRQLAVELEIIPAMGTLVRGAEKSGAFDELVETTARTKIPDLATLLVIGPPDGWGRVPWNRAARTTIPASAIVEKVAVIRTVATAAVATSVQRRELEVTVDCPRQAETGRPLPIRIVVKNTGQAAVDEVVVGVELPEQLSHNSGRSLMQRIGRMEAGEERRMPLVVQVQSAGEAAVRADAFAADRVSTETESHVTIRTGAKRGEPALPCPCSIPPSGFSVAPLY